MYLLPSSWRCHSFPFVRRDTPRPVVAGKYEAVRVPRQSVKRSRTKYNIGAVPSQTSPNIYFRMNAIKGTGLHHKPHRVKRMLSRVTRKGKSQTKCLRTRETKSRLIHAHSQTSPICRPLHCHSLFLGSSVASEPEASTNLPILPSRAPV